MNGTALREKPRLAYLIGGTRPADRPPGVAKRDATDRTARERPPCDRAPLEKRLDASGLPGGAGTRNGQSGLAAAGAQLRAHARPHAVQRRGEARQHGGDRQGNKSQKERVLDEILAFFFTDKVLQSVQHDFPRKVIIELEPVSIFRTDSSSISKTAQLVVSGFLNSLFAVEASLTELYVSGKAKCF